MRTHRLWQPERAHQKNPPSGGIDFPLKAHTLTDDPAASRNSMLEDPRTLVSFA
jgi:hypothetical protein